MDLKVMYTMLKTPRLCDEFHKAMFRVKKDSKTRKAEEAQRFVFIQEQMKGFPSQQAYFDDFAVKIKRVKDSDGV